ncbi:tyrosine-type recombinase/integrase [Clostridium sp. LBM24168]
MVKKGRKTGYSIGIIRKEKLLFKDLCAMYFKRCEANGITKYTVDGYKNVLKYFIRFECNEKICCDEININLFEDFKLYLKNERKVKDITVNSYIRKLTPMLTYGMQLGYIEKFPYSYVKCQKVYKDIYTDEELSILLKRPKGKQTTNRFAEFRNWVICNFLLGTGVRALELRELKIKNLDLTEDLLNLVHTKNKKPRQVPIPKRLHNILIEYLQFRKGNQDDYLFCNSFGERMPRTTLQMGITKYAKKRGIYKYSLHLFRHTFATLYLRNGGSIHVLKAILGHSSYKMVDIYLHMAGKDLKQSIKFNPLDRIKVENKQITMKLKGGRR